MKKIFTLLLLFIACSSPKEEEVWVAKVGDQTITPRDFLLNYEFGFPQYKNSDNPKEQYLDKMIMELLLAEEAYRLNLDTLSSIQNAVETFEKERLIEEVFNTYVMANIEISDDEIVDEINKSVVSFQFRFLPALTEAQAFDLKTVAERDGFDEALSMIRSDIGNAPLEQDNVQSPFVKAEDIDPELLIILQDLPLQTLSEPVPYLGQWFIFEVTNLKRTPLADSDYKTKSVTYEKVLYNRKAMEGATVFISDLMEPKDIRTKRSAFSQLNASFYEWYKEITLSGDVLAQIKSGEAEYQKRIKLILNEPLVEVEGETWTVEKWLQEFEPGLYQLRPDSFEYFTSQFSNVIALVVRDHFLLEMAGDDNLVQSNDVQKDIKRWESKWLFQELRKQYLNETEFTNEAVQVYFNNHASKYGIEEGASKNVRELSELLQKRVRKDYLTNQIVLKANVLKQNIPVEINYAVLDTIQVSKSQKIPVTLFNQNSNRMAFPVVDPNW